MAKWSERNPDQIDQADGGRALVEPLLLAAFALLLVGAARLMGWL